MAASIDVNLFEFSDDCSGSDTAVVPRTLLRRYGFQVGEQLVLSLPAAEKGKTGRSIKRMVVTIGTSLSVPNGPVRIAREFLPALAQAFPENKGAVGYSRNLDQCPQEEEVVVLAESVFDSEDLDRWLAGRDRTVNAGMIYNTPLGRMVFLAQDRYDIAAAGGPAPNVAACRVEGYASPRFLLPDGEIAAFPQQWAAYREAAAADRAAVMKYEATRQTGRDVATEINAQKSRLASLLREVEAQVPFFRDLMDARQFLADDVDGRRLAANLAAIAAFFKKRDHADDASRSAAKNKIGALLGQRCNEDLPEGSGDIRLLTKSIGKGKEYLKSLPEPSLDPDQSTTKEIGALVSLGDEIAALREHTKRITEDIKKLEPEGGLISNIGDMCREIEQEKGKMEGVRAELASNLGSMRGDGSSPQDGPITKILKLLSDYRSDSVAEIGLYRSVYDLARAASQSIELMPPEKPVGRTAGTSMY